MGRKGEEATFTSLQYQQSRAVDFGKQDGHKALTKTERCRKGGGELQKSNFLDYPQTLQLLPLSPPSHPTLIPQQNSRLEAPKLFLCTTL